ncbi:MAG: hypothetical protein HPY54_14265 [Chthonomonadetes bacterium]|nr:hypothetical protein [Chthonomonadetes bacterium]
MKYPVVLHRRVHKKIRDGKVPHDKVAKCLRALSSGDGKSVGLGMKRLNGISTPVFEARVDLDFP